MTDQPSSPDQHDPVSADAPEIVHPPESAPEPVVASTAVFEPVTQDAPAPTFTPPPAPVPPAPMSSAPVSSAPVPPAAPPQWPAAGYAPPQGGYPPPQAGYPAYPGYAAPPAAQTSTNAVVALVLAMAAWVVCPIVAAVVALIFAHQGDKEIAASGGRVSGQGLVTAAKWVAWVNIGLMLAGIVAMGFVFLLIAVAGGLNAG